MLSDTVRVAEEDVSVFLLIRLGAFSVCVAVTDYILHLNCVSNCTSAGFSL